VSFSLSKVAFLAHSDVALPSAAFGLWPISAGRVGASGQNVPDEKAASTIAAPRGGAFNKNPQHTDSLGASSDILTRRVLAWSKRWKATQGVRHRPVVSPSGSRRLATRASSTGLG
jgi:hypothetical protein